MQTNFPEPIPCEELPTGSHTQGPYSTVLINSGPGIRQLKTDPELQSPLKLFNQDSPKSTYAT